MYWGFVGVREKEEKKEGDWQDVRVNLPLQKKKSHQKVAGRRRLRAKRTVPSGLSRSLAP